MRLSSYRVAPRFSLVFLPLLAACSSVPMPDFSDVRVTDYVTPYKVDVRQGNYVTQEMVSQLKPGLSQQQVRFILGTPLLVDSFHKDRWDYLYRFQPGRGEGFQTRRMTVFFDDGKLVRVAGDVAAASTAAAADLPAPSVGSKVIEIEPGKAGQKKDDSWFSWPSWGSDGKDEKKDVKPEVKAVEKKDDSWFSWPSWLGGSKDEKKDVKPESKGGTGGEAKANTSAEAAKSSAAN